jgi:hypothetical protein
MDFPGKTSQAQSKSPPKSGSAVPAAKNGQSGFGFDHESEEATGMESAAFAFGKPAVPVGPLAQGRDGGPSRKALWLRRLTMALFVVVCVEVGIFLVVIPWTHIWTDNSLLIRNLTLRSLAMHNFVRGLVTGLGLINVWMGIWEAVHYREPKREATS